jgi:hypothetical protein
MKFLSMEIVVGFSLYRFQMSRLNHTDPKTAEMTANTQMKLKSTNMGENKDCCV